MYIGTEEQRKKRLKELEKLNKESESDPKNNGPFTQVYQKGWERIRELSKDKQGVVAIPLYSFLAEHIDPYMRCCCCRSAVFTQINWVLAEAQLSAGSTT
uniref:Helix-turn-helix domain-containing protein n=1 Tax=Escherichia coli TaxID=562 RepID=A0A3G4RXN2_ECOLX|nr:helix-turn-helix domain-containing protein [Escherichia coli]